MQPSKDGYACILDRVTGKPMIGIPEQPVMQNAAQGTTATQPVPIGGDIMPHSIDIAPDGYDLVNGRPDVHSLIDRRRSSRLSPLRTL